MNLFSNRPASFARRNPAVVLALAALAAVGAPSFAFAQGGDAAQPAPRNPSESLEPIAAEGFQAFMNLMAQFAQDQIGRLPSADKSARENAYGKLAAIQFAGAGSALLLPGAGLAIGGGIGLIVDGSTGGISLGSGTLAGSSIGLGSGMVVGLGAFVTSLLATLPMIDEIEAKYPAEGGAAAPARNDSRSFMLVGNSYVLASAGAMESYYVNLVACLPDQFVTLVEQWDRTPGLGNQEKQWLRSVEFARPHLQRLAWIKRNLRVSPNAPRANDLFLDVGRVLSGDAAAMERAWLTALGLGATGLELKNDKLALAVPQPLQALGVPAKLTANVPDLRVKVGGNGGALDPFLRLRLEAGPFEVDWGTVSVVKSGADKDLVAVRYAIARGSRLGSARITVKAGGNEDTVVDFRPSLDRTLEGTLYFKLDGMNLSFQKAQVGNVELRLGLPAEVRNLPIVKDLLNGLLADFERDVRNFLRDTVPFAKLFDGFGQASARSLAQNVQRQAGSHGLARIDEVRAAKIQNGVMQVTVRGKELRHPSLGKAPQEAAAAWQGFANQQRKVPVGRPVGQPVRRLPGQLGR
jgi:hypothetical protein